MQNKKLVNNFLSKFLVVSLFALILAGTEVNAGQDAKVDLETEPGKVVSDRPFFDQIYEVWKKSGEKPETWLEKNATLLVIGAATILTGYICAKIYFAYKDGQEIYKLIKEFNENPYYTYENFTSDARNLYYKQSVAPRSTSLSNDYPIASFLEKRATEIKNLLGSNLFSVLFSIFFCSKLTTLSKDLKKELILLRNNSEFQQERIEFNREYRKQNYRNFRMLIVR